MSLKSNLRKVTVKYIFEGKMFESENEPGLLLSGNKVLVARESLGLYQATPTEDPNVYIVNLDENDKDYLVGVTSVIDLIA
ncbi:hypothetical protein [Bacillus massiliglaciei]|uniref:hypothetical protein n=1 Tax=Bacillus massiliglaciei TaxID=1816693 RepID=UPI000DA61301|nr:hypothetical protein [Bacillus massiliglaciei]